MRRRPPIRWALGWALLAGLAGQAHAGAVRGQLTVPADRAEPPGEGLWRVDNGILPVLPRTVDLRAECLLVLQPHAEAKPDPTKIELKKEPKKEETITVEARGLRLTQVVIAAAVGNTLEIKNEDRVPHTFYTAPPDETVLPLRPTAAGTTRTDKIPRAGAFTLLDDEMPHIRAWLVVTDGGIAIRPDERGGFRADVPDGRYLLRVFYRGTWVVERELDLGVKPIELTLALPPRSSLKREPTAEPMRPTAAPPAPARAPATDGGAAR